MRGDGGIIFLELMEAGKMFDHAVLHWKKQIMFHEMTAIIWILGMIKKNENVIHWALLSYVTGLQC